jgi:lipoyl(octanoyl) transferase
MAMRTFTAERTAITDDEIWLMEHPPVYTQGIGGKPEHVLTSSEIPIIQTERGGQVTYHGPGQVVAYTLIDLQRARLPVRTLVCRLEQAARACCAAWGVETQGKTGAPGVYLSTPSGEAGAKIASVGLKVRRGCCYHGLALNVAMDLSPFERINPCGYAGLPVTDLTRAWQRAAQPAAPAPSLAAVAAQLGAALVAHLEPS